MAGQTGLPYTEVGVSQVHADLDLFSNPTLSTGIESSHLVTIYPNAPISNSSNSFSFDLYPDSNLIDLYNSLMSVTLKIVKATDGTNIPAFTAAHNCGFINAPLYTIWKSCEVKINDIVVSSSYNTFGYASMFQLLLNYGADYAETKGPLFGFYRVKDPSVCNSFDSIGGYKDLNARVAESKSMTLCGPILGSYIFSISRLMLGMTKISLTFTKQPDEFVLKKTGDRNYKYIIEDFKLHFKKVQLYPSSLLALEQRLSTTDAIYPTTHFFVKELSLPAQSRSEIFPNVFSSAFLPSRVILAVVNTTNFLGSFTTSPFDLTNANIEECYFTSDSRKFPNIDFNLNFSTTDKKADHTYGYLSLFRNAGLRGDHGPINIQYENYPTHYMMLCFDFGNVENYGEYFNEKTIGNVSLHIKMKENTTEAKKILLYTEFQEIIKISQARVITRDFEL